MTTESKDRLLGVILLSVAVLWCWASWATIPRTFSGPVTARDMPIALGVLLGLFALILLGSTFRPGRSRVDETDEGPNVPLATEVWAVAWTVGLLAGYAALMYFTGFLVATTVVVLVALVVPLGYRSWRFVMAMTVFVPIGTYIVFNKILGVYLPHGRWIDIWF